MTHLDDDARVIQAQKQVQDQRWDQLDAEEVQANGQHDPKGSRATRISGDLRAEHKIDSLVSAVFGNPYDHDDNGIVGDIRTLTTLMHDKLDKLFVAVMGLAGVLIIVAVTVAIAVR